jgi:hypothetical protein
VAVVVFRIGVGGIDPALKIDDAGFDAIGGTEYGLAVSPPRAKEKGPDVPRHPAPGIPVHALTDPCSNAGPRRATALATSGCTESYA